MQQTLECVDRCLECAAACLRCVNHSYADHETVDAPFPGACIECAEICTATAKIVSIDGSFAADIAPLCAEICQWTSEQCRDHANELCRDVAGPALRCAQACRSYYD